MISNSVEVNLSTKFESKTVEFDCSLIRNKLSLIESSRCSKKQIIDTSLNHHLLKEGMEEFEVLDLEKEFMNETSFRLRPCLISCLISHESFEEIWQMFTGDLFVLVTDWSIDEIGINLISWIWIRFSLLWAICHWIVNAKVHSNWIW